MSRDTYLLDIKKAFPAFGKEEVVYFNRFTKSINENSEENENYDYYSSRFGNPKEIVESFYDDLEPQGIYSRMKDTRFKQKCLKLIFLFLIINTIIFFGVLNLVREDAKDSHGSYFDTSITYE